MGNNTESAINLNSITYNGEGGFLLNVNETGNYISNQKVKIFCSNFVKSAVDGEIFFSIRFVPDGIPLSIPSRLFDIFYYDKIAKDISEIDNAKDFILKFSNSFSSNNWYSKEWMNRLIAKMNLSLSDKIILIYEIDGFNQTRIISLCLKGTIQYSSDKFLKIIPYEIVSTSKNILSVYDIRKNLEKKIPDFNTMLVYFDISNKILDDLQALEIADVTGISYFNTDLNNTESRKKLYEVMDRVDNLNEDVNSYIAIRFRHVENELRLGLGYNAVGSLFTESLLFNRIKNEFTEYQIISQFSPTWLMPQRFDIYFKEKNIAIEYNGIQHYKAVDYFGGEEGFAKTIKRDIEKRKKCKANNCILIEIKYDEDFEVAVKKIISVIRGFQ